MLTAKQACKKAIKAAGGPAGMARYLNGLKGRPKITRSGVSQWSRVPPGRVLDVEAVLKKVNSDINRHQLRSDLYPLEAK
jgi:hypothetical protein